MVKQESHSSCACSAAMSESIQALVDAARTYRAIYEAARAKRATGSAWDCFIFPYERDEHDAEDALYAAVFKMDPESSGCSHRWVTFGDRDRNADRHDRHAAATFVDGGRVSCDA